MGTYNIYCGIQIKAGNCELEEYQLGDTVDLDDGVYVAPDGVIVVRSSFLIAKFEYLYDKWGNKIECEVVSNINHPIKKIIRDQNIGNKNSN